MNGFDIVPATRKHTVAHTLQDLESVSPKLLRHTMKMQRTHEFKQLCPVLDRGIVLYALILHC